MTEAERFWRKVDYGNHFECWLWTVAKDPNGYGIFHTKHGYDKRKLVKAHRWSYEAMIGPIPEELFVFHSCEVASCVNPAHLFVSTSNANLPRKVKAVDPSKARKDFTPDQIRAIRADTRSQTLIAKDYDVTLPTISRIKLRYNYAWVDD